MKRWLGAVAAVGLVACGGDGGTGAVQGAVTGQGMKAVEDAIYLSLPSGMGGDMGIVVVSDHGGMCDLMKESGESASAPVRDASMLMLMLANVQGMSFGAVDAGSYPVASAESEEVAGRFSMAIFDHVDSTGSSTVGEAGMGTGGAVTVASVEAKKGGGAEGTFTLQFGEDALTGSFDAQYCDAAVSVATAQRLLRAAQ